MTEIVNITAAKARFSKLVDRAAVGEEIVIAKSGKPKVKLVPYRVVHVFDLAGHPTATLCLRLVIADRGKHQAAFLRCAPYHADQLARGSGAGGDRYGTAVAPEMRWLSILWLFLGLWAARAVWIFGVGLHIAWTCFLPGHFWDWWFWKGAILSMLVPWMLPPGAN
jgi:prevent-host-death family protein